ncbi:MAG: 4,5-DOPA dioxygenase extradiol [Chromatiales bacterium]|nr:4,5-DOPA dioxygenase extradiol [Chromatiales bacterium]
MPQKLPALFLGHGNPMNALATNPWTEAWSRLGRETGKPRAVLCISAHWYGPGCSVTAMATPRTIHDFGGFPRELFEVQYPAPGDPALAERVRSLLAPVDVAPDHDWGLDHGAWSVLIKVFPAADVPVVQLRIDATRPPAWHYALGRALRPLREEGVLIVGSGNLVHNLQQYGWGEPERPAYDWATRFEARARALIAAGDHEPLIGYEQLGRDARLSIPTPEHYLPLLYVLGAQEEGEAVSFPVEGTDGGSISMLAVQVGQ